MKRLISFLLSAALLAANAFPAAAIGVKDVEKTEYDFSGVKSYVLTEAATGQNRILAGKNEDTRLPVASLTKLMLLLIVAEEISAGRVTMSDIVTTSASAAAKDGSVIWLRAGEKMEMGELVKSVVISSANDAAAAIACHLSGTEEAFIARMNAKAAELGLVNTQYRNVAGYDEDGHYSTAADTAVILSEVLKYSYFAEFFMTRLDNVRPGTDNETQLLNTNKLIKYKGMIGGKTGTTTNAGYCLSAGAERGNLRLIAVVLGAGNEDGRTSAVRSLLDGGFAGWSVFTPDIADNEKIHPVKVEKGVAKTAEAEIAAAPAAVIPKGRGADVKYSYILTEKVTAPVAKGDKLGAVYGFLDGEKLFQADITAKTDCPELTFRKSFEIMLGAFLLN
ncbi:D-alanyl-D-alanine carboxypeptidase [Clostridia bacterium]|nr:D-alanyl-D-alanine carboxypeptidase [Clostridia bacterium]